jgi:hypothetical protein
MVLLIMKHKNTCRFGEMCVHYIFKLFTTDKLLTYKCEGIHKHK